MDELTDERIMELAIECGIGHTVIDADLAYAMGVELGTRHIVDDVEPGDTIAFARAIAAEVADQGDAVARLLTWSGPQHQPVPHDGICARTFVEFPKGAGEVEGGYWREGEPLYTRPAAPAGWKTIDSAPKDGTEVWAFNGEQAQMRFIEGEGYALWVWSDDALSDIDPSPDQPTHWMPLPAAPSPKGQPCE